MAGIQIRRNTGIGPANALNISGTVSSQKYLVESMPESKEISSG